MDIDYKELYFNLRNTIIDRIEQLTHQIELNNLEEFSLTTTQIVIKELEDLNIEY